MSLQEQFHTKFVVTNTEKNNVFRVRVCGNSDNHFVVVPEGSTAEIVYKPENSILQVKTRRVASSFEKRSSENIVTQATQARRRNKCPTDSCCTVL